MEKENKGYVGKVSNKGMQFVEAPIKQTPPKLGKVKTGGDLRTGTDKK